ncbi:OLC1v1037879C1 [Oldenlandia corymbosa var. corymbosa]|uniref:OLC1v1037879C1 n=1 Tax=Oldenlandia corymbosa var. corymbosa TaxID=529605 RepID=A0AAV1D127_OLDCO|nr:OLC1v1037879C1 [Oldenlandia corymbosa var. corymbosa]
MSIVFERSSDSSSVTNSGATNNSYNLDHDHRGGGIGGLGFSGRQMGCFPIYGNGTETGNKPPELGGGGGRKLFDDDRSGDSSSSTSSIGRNSDDDEESSAGRSSESGGGGGDSEEVQSKLKTGALDSLEALEEVLPIKRSISQFYSGKSKSFTSLSDAATCSSVNEIVKPENAYTRKRKNLMAFNNFWDNKNHSIARRSNGGGIAKRSAGSRSTLALAAAMGCTESNNNSDSSSSTSPSPCVRLPPLPPHRRRSPDLVSSSPQEKNFSPWRSFSLSDLQGRELGCCQS